MSDQLWQRLSNFVYSTLASIDRDETHDALHMEQVATLALQLISSDCSKFSDELADLVMIVGWLHDVNDHKYYDPQIELKLNEFIDLLPIEFPSLQKSLEPWDHERFSENVKNAIKFISFSAEVKLFGFCQPAQWEKYLDPIFVDVRNLVSDADKLEALGYRGIRRCLGYAKHVDPELSWYDQHLHLVEHTEVKLRHLPSHYIVSEKGKQRAVGELQILLDYIETFKKNHSI